MPERTAGAASRLQWRLATFYFFYYGTVGAFMPYWSPYLQARGFSPAQMGIAYAGMGVLRCVVPLAWGWYADHSGRRMALIRVASAIALMMFLVIPFVPGVWWVGVCMLGYTLFWHGLLAQFEAVALTHLEAVNGDYARVRLWGSLGFILSVLGIGALLDLVGVLWLPYLVAIFWIGMAASSWFVPETPPLHPHARERTSFAGVLRDPGVLALLAVCLCSQLSFAPYYNFFSLFIERHGYSRSLIGVLWAVAVIAEIVLFLYASRLIPRVGARRMMILALTVTALRWALTGAGAQSLSLLMFLQLSHAFSFAAFHAVAMRYVQHYFPGALQGRGQAVYNAVAYGLGGSLGSLGGGYLWELWRPAGVFYAAAAVALLGSLIAWRRLPALPARAAL